jgi:hypothetical protein
MTAVRRLSVLMALGLSCVAATASARSLRFPEAGDPAFYMELPDDWTTRKDPSGNLIVLSADHAIAFSLNVFNEQVTADDVARKALAVQKVTPIPDRQRASIWGFDGVSYHWRSVNASNVKLEMTLIVVQIDATHVANCTKIVSEASSPETYQIADWFVHDLRISRLRP